MYIKLFSLIDSLSHHAGDETEKATYYICCYYYIGDFLKGNI